MAGRAAFNEAGQAISAQMRGQVESPNRIVEVPEARQTIPAPRSEPSSVLGMDSRAVDALPEESPRTPADAEASPRQTAAAADADRQGLMGQIPIASKDVLPQERLQADQQTQTSEPPKQVSGMSADEIRSELSSLNQPTGGILPVIRKRLEKARGASVASAQPVSENAPLGQPSSELSQKSSSPNLTPDTTRDESSRTTQETSNEVRKEEGQGRQEVLTEKGAAVEKMTPEQLRAELEAGGVEVAKDTPESELRSGVTELRSLESKLNANILVQAGREPDTISKRQPHQLEAIVYGRTGHQPQPLDAAAHAVGQSDRGRTDPRRARRRCRENKRSQVCRFSAA